MHVGNAIISNVTVPINEKYFSVSKILFAVLLGFNENVGDIQLVLQFVILLSSISVH